MTTVLDTAPAARTTRAADPASVRSVSLRGASGRTAPARSRSAAAARTQTAGRSAAAGRCTEAVAGARPARLGDADGMLAESTVGWRTVVAAALVSGAAMFGLVGLGHLAAGPADAPAPSVVVVDASR